MSSGVLTGEDLIAGTKRRPGQSPRVNLGRMWILPVDALRRRVDGYGSVADNDRSELAVMWVMDSSRMSTTDELEPAQTVR
jgi:hypothetical protein